MQNESSNPAGTLTELQSAQISDLADGQLRGEAFAQAMTLMNDSSQARTQWHSLHLIGDVLRAKEVVSCAKDAEFLNTFRAKLSLESHLADANPVHLQALRASDLNPKTTPTPVPANEPFFSWKWAAGLSALAASVILGLNLIGTTAVAPAVSGGQLAQISVPISADGPAVVMLRNPQLDALIAAHNQASGSSAFQMPSGFLRSATYSPTLAGDK